MQLMKKNGTGNDNENRANTFNRKEIMKKIIVIKIEPMQSMEKKEKVEKKIELM